MSHAICRGRVRAELKRSIEGGGGKYVKRHLDRGMLLPRDRVEMLLDAASFFLDNAEVVLRIGARAMEKAPVERFLKEIVPIALNGPPSVAGLSAERSKVDEIIAYAPALIPKTVVSPRVGVIQSP